jgi:cytochrome P450
LLNSDLPGSEKTNARLSDEAQLVVAAGLTTTSWALTVGSYHLSSNDIILCALRAKPEETGIRTTADCDWNKLKKLPYLNGVIHESIRLAHGISTRSPRLSPDSELTYGYWIIPKNKPVSMSAVDVLINKEIFPEPKKFWPERWINNPGLDRFFVPLAKGSRQCLGIKLVKPSSYFILE